MKYDSDRLAVWLVLDRNYWEICVGPSGDADPQNPLAHLCEYLNVKPSPGTPVGLANCLSKNFEALCALYSPSKYPSFKADYDQWARARSRRLHPGWYESPRDDSR